MAGATGFDLVAGRSCHAVAGGSRRPVRRPVRRPPPRGRAGKALVQSVRRSPPVGPCQMLLGRTMAAFTSDADLREAGVEAVGRRVIVLADGCRMTVRAHVVPVLLAPRPVKRVARWNGFVGIEMDPA